MAPGEQFLGFFSFFFLISKLSLGSESSDMTSEGLGRCLKVTVEASVPENFR